MVAAMSETSAPIRQALRDALPGAMKARDTPARNAIRSALAAIENAEAIAQWLDFILIFSGVPEPVDGFERRKPEQRETVVGETARTAGCNNPMARDCEWKGIVTTGLADCARGAVGVPGQLAVGSSVTPWNACNSGPYTATKVRTAQG